MNALMLLMLAISFMPPPRKKQPAIRNVVNVSVDVYGKVDHCPPANGKWYEYRELRKIVGGLIQEIPIPGTDLVMLIDEEGGPNIKNLPLNQCATKILEDAFKHDASEIESLLTSMFGAQVVLLGGGVRVAIFGKVMIVHESTLR